MDYQNTSPLKPNFLNNPVLQSRSFIIFVIICVLVFFALGIAGDYYFALPKTKACTQETQICPDGSSVGRTGPNCEFTPCSTICGGWDTSGEIICECSGKITKSVCPTNIVCDSGTYTCQGLCSRCCYKGIAQNSKYPKCIK